MADRKKTPSFQILPAIGEAYRSVASSDRMTRRVSLVLWASTLGFILTIVLSFWVATDRIQASKQLTAEQMIALQKAEEEAKKKAEIAALKELMIDLGSYMFQVTSPSGPVKAGIKDLGSIDIVAKCSDRAVCAYITEHKAQAQHEVSAVFKPMTRDEIVSVEGKKRLKKKILLRLNTWLKQGQVEDLYFTKFLVD